MHLFTNDPVEISSLPKAEEINLQPIEPSYKKVLLWEWMIGWGIVFLCAAVAILVIPSLHSMFWISVISAPLFLFCFLNLWLSLNSFYRKAYALRDKDLIYRRGWLIQRLSVCPFNRIQHCSVNAGPFERKLGLSSISVYTAGTEGADIKIPGLKEATALSLRDFIMKKTGIDEQPRN